MVQEAPGLSQSGELGEIIPVFHSMGTTLYTPDTRGGSLGKEDKN